MPRMPALFIGHGSPMNVLEDNAVTRGWRAVAARLPRPKAILCVSAHWESRGVFVCAVPQPPTIHDFYGFPQALYDMRYPAPGAPDVARRVVETVTGIGVHETSDWGLDHGAWCVLHVMYPDADIPVLQLSLDTAQSGAFHYALGRELAALRDEGILLMGSGNIVHNLRLIDFRHPAPPDWVSHIDAAVRARIVERRHEDLIEWQRLGPHMALAAPTPEHYLPLLYVLGAQAENERAELFNTEAFSTLSMTSALVC